MRKVKVVGSIFAGLVALGTLLVGVLQLNSDNVDRGIAEHAIETEKELIATLLNFMEALRGRSISFSQEGAKEIAENFELLGKTIEKSSSENGEARVVIKNVYEGSFVVPFQETIELRSPSGKSAPFNFYRAQRGQIWYKLNGGKGSMAEADIEVFSKMGVNAIRQAFDGEDCRLLASKIDTEIEPPIFKAKFWCE